MISKIRTSFAEMGYRVAEVSRHAAWDRTQTDGPGGDRSARGSDDCPRGERHEAR
jgi:hypothetical protein